MRDVPGVSTVNAMLTLFRGLGEVDEPMNRAMDGSDMMVMA
jgi:hypothetical protein